MIIAILPDASHTETLLNNLSEADFDLAQVSVLMHDLKLRKKVAKDTGPLKGVNDKTLAVRLSAAGMSDVEIKPYADALAQGKVLVAIVTPPESQSAAEEMLKDHSAEMIKGIG